MPRAQKRIAAFKAAVPAAFSAEDWGFVFIHNRCTYGTKIVHSSGKMCVLDLRFFMETGIKGLFESVHLFVPR